MNRRYAIFSKRLELIQSREPAFQMSFLQIEVRLVVDQIRRKKRLGFRNVYRSDVLAFAFTKFDDIQLDALRAQDRLRQRLGNHEAVVWLRSRPRMAGGRGWRW